MHLWWFWKIWWWWYAENLIKQEIKKRTAIKYVKVGVHICTRDCTFKRQTCSVHQFFIITSLVLFDRIRPSHGKKVKGGGWKRLVFRYVIFERSLIVTSLYLFVLEKTYSKLTDALTRSLDAKAKMTHENCSDWSTRNLEDGIRYYYSIRRS